MRTVLEFWAAVLVSTASVRATTWYVDDVPANGNGLSGSPWNSIATAVSEVVTPGDTIHVHAGHYTLSAQASLAVGVNLEGEGREATVITCTTTDDAIRLYSSGFPTAGNVLKDFKLQTANKTTPSGITNLGRHNVRVLNVAFDGFRVSGVTMYGANVTGEPATYLTGLEIAHCSLNNCSSSGGQSYSGCIQIGHAYRALVHDNEIHGWRDDHGYGIKFAQGGWLWDCEIFNNIVDLTPYTITGGWGSPFSIEFFNAHSDTEIYGNTINGCISLAGNRDTGHPGTQVRVHDNVAVFLSANDKEGVEGILSRLEIYNNYWENTASRGGVNMDWGADDYSVHHNVFRNCRGDAVRINPRGEDARNALIYNNTVDNCMALLYLNNSNTSGGVISNLVVRNNLIVNNDYGVRILVAAPALTVTGASVDFCDFHANGQDLFYATGASPVAWGAHNLSVSPQLTFSGAIPYPHYAHSSPGANMVDAGNATGLPYAYSGTVATPDIGACEQGLTPRSRVTVAATDAQGAESGMDPAVFTVTRTQAAGSITVSYATSGSATRTDFNEILAGTLTFADGQTVATLTVTPVDDAVRDGDRTLTVTLTPGSAYDLTAQRDAATVTLADDEAVATVAGFESAEGYSLGDVNGKKGWVCSAGSPAPFQVVASPLGGDRALRVANGVRYLSGKWSPAAAELGGAFDAASSTLAFGFEIYAGGTWGYHGMNLRIGQSGKGFDINLRDRKYYSGATPVPLEVATGIGPDFRVGWVRCEGLIDYATRKFLLNVNGVPQMGTTPDGWHSLRDPAASATELFPVVEIYADAIEAYAYLDRIGLQLIQTITLPVVQIAATDASAAEAGQDPGRFRIWRDQTSGALTVNYTLGGSASAADFTASPALSGSIAIPDGNSAVDITVTPVDDTLVESGGETLVLTLTATAAYDVGPAQTAAVALADNDGAPPSDDITFETSQGYALGNVNGQQGWTAPADGVWAVTNSAASGQVLRAGPDVRYAEAVYTPDADGLGGTFDADASVLDYAFDYYAGDGICGYKVQRFCVGTWGKGLNCQPRDGAHNVWKYYDGATEYLAKAADGATMHLEGAGWVHISGRIDYAAKKFTMHVADVQQLGGTTDGWLGFRDPAATAVDLFPKLRVYVDGLLAPVQYDNFDLQLQDGLNAYGVPLAWLSRYGANPVLAHNDGDDRSDFDEWLASTHPLRHDRFAVAAIGRSPDGRPSLSWVGEPRDPALPPFRILSRTSFADEWETIAGTITYDDEGGVYTWVADEPTADAAFFQISAGDGDPTE